MSTDNRTAAEIERDLERERARLGSTIEDLGSRMSVEHITAELSQQLRSAGSDAFRDATDRIIANARTNPAAVALAGAGLVWLMLGQKPKSGSSETPPPTFPPERIRRSRPLDPPPPRPAYAEPPRKTLGDHAEQIGKSALGSLQDGVDDLRARIAEGTENLAEEGKARVIEARRAAVAAAETAVDSVKAKARPAIASVEENPWVYGGIALALGAAIGGAMLYRRSEDEARRHRNDVFAEADRIWREEAEREIVDRNTSVVGKPPPTSAAS